MMNKKRFISLLLAMALICTMLPAGGLEVQAADNYDMVYYPVEEGSFYFDKLSGVLYDFVYNDSTQQVSLTIPQTIEGIEVRVIGTFGPGDGFWGDTNLVGIELPSTMTSIGPWAFKDTGITSITFPASIKDIAKAAFSGCEDLTLIRFLGDAPSIYEDAFEGVEATVVYPADNTTWTADVMQNYGGTLTWKPSTVEYPVEGGVLQFNMLTGEITDFVGSGEYADIVIPSQIEGVPVTKIGAGVFDGSAVASISLPEGLEQIGDSAFEMSAISAIKIPASVTRIGKSAFWGSNIDSVEIPAGVTEIGAYAFTCPIYVSAGNEYYSSDEYGVLYNKDKTTLLYGFPTGEVVVVPASVKRIADSAFAYVSYIKTVIFEGNAPEFGVAPFEKVSANAYYPEGSTTWTDAVMQNYGGTLTWKPSTVEYPVEGGVLQFNMLTGEIEKFTPTNDTEEVSVVIPSEIEGVAVTAITYNRADGAEGYQAGSGAFEDCKNVVNVTLPETLSYIGWGAFAESGITQITIPESVTRLDPYSFFGSKLQSVEILGKVELRGANFAECYDLREVKFLGDAPEFWSGDGWHVFGPMLEADENINVTIYYPAENTTWTEAVMQNHGGNLKWVPMCQPVGDFDNDEEVTDSDAIYLLRHTLFPETYPIYIDGDVNSDGMINDADAIYLLRYTLFPENYPLYP